jgi:hypothetical protein
VFTSWKPNHRVQQKVVRNECCGFLVCFTCLKRKDFFTQVLPSCPSFSLSLSLSLLAFLGKKRPKTQRRKLTLTVYKDLTCARRARAHLPLNCGLATRTKILESLVISLAFLIRSWLSRLLHFLTTSRKHDDDVRSPFCF